MTRLLYCCWHTSQIRNNTLWMEADDLLRWRRRFSLSIWCCVSVLQQWPITQTKIRVISTLLFVLFGCLLFVGLPAAIFKHIEGWSALESLYFVVITLTTIGFGDFVAGTSTESLVKGQHTGRHVCRFLAVYQTCRSWLLLWLIVIVSVCCCVQAVQK